MDWDGIVNIGHGRQFWVDPQHVQWSWTGFCIHCCYMYIFYSCIKRKAPHVHCVICTVISCGDWFDIVVMGLVTLMTSTELSDVEPCQYWDWRRPLAGLLSRYLCRPLSLAILLWESEMSNANGFSCLWGRNSEFCCYKDCWLTVW